MIYKTAVKITITLGAVSLNNNKSILETTTTLLLQNINKTVFRYLSARAPDRLEVEGLVLAHCAPLEAVTMNSADSGIT